MVLLCVVCTAIRPPMLSLSAEHRQIYETMVSPFVNLTPLKCLPMFMCLDCEELLEKMQQFQATAVVGVKRLLSLLNATEPTDLIPEVKTEIEMDAEPQNLLPTEVNSGIKCEPDTGSTQSDDASQTIPAAENCARTISVTEVSNQSNMQTSVLQGPLSHDSETKWEIFTRRPANVSTNGITDDASRDAPSTEQVNSQKSVSEPPKNKTAAPRARSSFECEVCHRSFKTIRWIYTHFQQKHPKIGSPVKCDVCEQDVPNKYLMNAHSQSHHKTKPPETIDNLRLELFCAECPMKFASPSAFKTHMTSLRHTTRDQWKFKCDSCERRFPTKSRLNEHAEYMHLKQNKHQCPQCPKSYSRLSGVRTHVATAHERRAPPRPHVCHVCGCSFTVKKSLREHLLKHEGLRPHRCPLCPATFTYRAALYTHNRLKHLKIKGTWKKPKKKQKEPKPAEKQEKSHERQRHQDPDTDIN